MIDKLLIKDAVSHQSALHGWLKRSRVCSSNISLKHEMLLPKPWTHNTSIHTHYDISLSQETMGIFILACLLKTGIIKHSLWFTNPVSMFNMLRDRVTLSSAQWHHFSKNQSSLSLRYWSTTGRARTAPISLRKGHITLIIPTEYTVKDNKCFMFI